MLFLFLVVVYSQSNCSLGCVDTCISPYTCGLCKEGYDNDNSCLYCVSQKVSGGIFLESSDGCTYYDKVTSATTWYPQTDIINFVENDTKVLSINTNSYVDFGPCTFPSNNYRLCQWATVNLSTFTNTVFVMKIKRKETAESKHPTLFVDFTPSQTSAIIPDCFVRSEIQSDSGIVTIPLASVPKSTVLLYVYFSINGLDTVDMEVSVFSDGNYTDYIQGVVFNQEMLNQLYFYPDTNYTVVFNFSNITNFHPALCGSNVRGKFGYLELYLRGDYTISINSTEDNRNLYLIEVDSYLHCFRVWTGERHGEYVMNNNSGIYVTFNASNSPFRRQFLVASPDFSYEPKLVIKAICPDHCNSINGNGACFVTTGECVCNDGFIGRDCHRSCWYNNKWVYGDGVGMCYHGTEHCDDYCVCESGYINDNHYCLSRSCINSDMSSMKKYECDRNTENCMFNCTCQEGYISVNHRCALITCGNDVLDVGEKCDGVPNCSEMCECINEYEEEGVLNKCVKKSMPAYVIVAIVVSITLFFVLVVSVTCGIIIFILTRKKPEEKIDLERQPSYYFTTSRSVNLVQDSTNDIPIKFYLSKKTLDFGNPTIPTEILTTRYENISFRNKSLSKSMMVIFHTPNDPKFILNFKPQVLFLSPISKAKTVTALITILCTTKIRGVQIPYTVWFAQSRSVLERIERILVNKSIQTWTQLDQISLDKEQVDVTLKYNGYLKIATDAAASMYIDLDELDLRTTPFEENDHHKLFLGSYRGIVVCVKEICSLKFTEEQWEVVKEEMLKVCQIQAKLRNPFIVNYIGNVSYTKDIYVVSQFYTCGSLDTFIYTKKDLDNVVLPFELKMKMLLDIAKGMHFLHYNNMLHLNLKPSNLMINSVDKDSACCIKIADFVSTPKLQNIKEEVGRVCTEYCAPEFFINNFQKQTDVYSYGVVAFELFFQKKVKLLVVDGKEKLGKINTLSLYEHSTPKAFKELVENCLRSDWNKRPTSSIVLDEIQEVLRSSKIYKNLDDGVDLAKLDNFVEMKQQQSNCDMMMN
ncbi:serine-threonine protein kinase, putative [Entamoeba invadens IP1]|uniref:Serine-threonine protein kinase, putative n=1 Tax=Entamoeba invadens IP1 TaxID=370355 RepID=A0A0A1UEX1_ENTIV|nr:serine-threonine protein kinase, putative [Entamoeba invadens IP1]ELP95008.1 serine-threonine protein kinase, putative [Entamoeba invadens IP1]|eukprot:XP_004261779.1 serine-threonine protein kinase, putative [Entamoeba invadens IP1]